MANKIFLLGLFLLSVANVKAQTLTQTDSLTMETMLHNLPEVMVKGSRPIVKAERGMLSYNMPLLLKQLPADNAYDDGKRFSPHCQGRAGYAVVQYAATLKTIACRQRLRGIDTHTWCQRCHRQHIVLWQ